MRLSVCIPTYNRESYIGETLRSALSQVTSEVEVVVCDNASSDNTRSVVEELFSNRPNVRYFRWDRNMGADLNFLKVIELASGEYCWFMGSDDIVEPGAVARILALLGANEPLTGLSVNRNAYDAELKKRIWERPVAGGAIPDDQLFVEPDATFSLLGEYFGYLPGQIVNRQRWNEVVGSDNLAPYLNAYVHVYVICRMIQRNPRWLYVSQRCAGWRSGNDSFMAQGRLKRLRIDVIGYEKIAGDVFGRSSAPYRDLMNTVATVHVRSALFGAKAQRAPASFFVQAAILCIKTYWSLPRFWITTFPVFLLPRHFYTMVRSIYRLTLKPGRVRRINAP